MIPVNNGILPDWFIRSYIPITPFAEGEKRPGKISYGLSSMGYDARLDRKFKVFSAVRCDVIVDPKKINERAFEDIEGDDLLIPPNGYALGSTVETFRIPDDVIAICLGKSTYARCGIICNVTPLEPGWQGTITIEISNSSPLPAKVYANEGIIQILFFRWAEKPEKTYGSKGGGGKYQYQTELTLPKVD